MPDGPGLFNLLPALHREADARRGRSLEALLTVVEEQAAALKRDIDGLWDDLFIETCAEWVVPYLGELVGNRHLPAARLSARADVAKTLSYRRWKGTRPMLEELARDVTGWATQVVPARDWLQLSRHAATPLPRPGAPAQRRFLSFSARDEASAPRGPRTPGARVADLRGGTGAHAGLDTVLFFTWRTQSCPLGGVTPRPAPVPYGFQCNPLGGPLPLYQKAETPETQQAQPVEALPVPLDAAALARELHAARVAAAGRSGDRPVVKGLLAHAAGGAREPEPEPEFPLDWGDEPGPAASRLQYGPGRSLNIMVDGEAVPPERVAVARLSPWRQPPRTQDWTDAEGAPRRSPVQVAVDVASGRLAFPGRKLPRRVAVDLHVGLSHPVGGGSYRRPRHTEAGTVLLVGGEADSGGLAALSVDGDAQPTPERFRTLGNALRAWRSRGRPDAVLLVADNRTYHERLDIEVPSGASLTVAAAPGCRPHVRPIGPWRLRSPPQDGNTLAGVEASSITLAGLLVEGGLEAQGRLRLAIEHCTLVPGRALDAEGRPLRPRSPSLWSGPDVRDIEVALEATICGPIRLPADGAFLVAAGCILDAPAPGVAAIAGPAGPGGLAEHGGAPLPGCRVELEATTIFGAVHTIDLVGASNVLFNDGLAVQRHPTGPLRYCYLPPGAGVAADPPPGFRCLPPTARHVTGSTGPGRARELARLRPRFVARRYGRVGYACLAATAAPELRHGSSEGAELGAHGPFRTAQREANLLARLEEYLPFGLQPALLAADPTPPPEDPS